MKEQCTSVVQMSLYPFDGRLEAFSSVWIMCLHNLILSEIFILRNLYVLTHVKMFFVNNNNTLYLYTKDTKYKLCSVVLTTLKHYKK